MLTPAAAWQGPSGEPRRSLVWSGAAVPGALGTGVPGKEEGLTQGWGTSGDKAQEWRSHHTEVPGPSCCLHSDSPKPFSMVTTARGRCWVRVSSQVKVAWSHRTLATRWTMQSMEFSRPASWSGQFPSPGDLPDPGIEPGAPAPQVGSSPAELPGEPGSSQGSFRSGSSNRGAGGGVSSYKSEEQTKPRSRLA